MYQLLFCCDGIPWQKASQGEGFIFTYNSRGLDLSQGGQDGKRQERHACRNKKFLQPSQIAPPTGYPVFMCPPLVEQSYSNHNINDFKKWEKSVLIIDIWCICLPELVYHTTHAYKKLPHGMPLMCTNLCSLNWKYLSK